MNRTTRLALCTAAALTACGQPGAAQTASQSRALLEAQPVPLPQGFRSFLRCSDQKGAEFGLTVVRPGGQFSAPDAPLGIIPETIDAPNPQFRGMSYGIYARMLDGPKGAPSLTALPREIFHGKYALLFSETDHGGIAHYSLDRETGEISVAKIHANRIALFRAFMNDGHLAELAASFRNMEDRASQANVRTPYGFFAGEQSRLAKAFARAFAQDGSFRVRAAEQSIAYPCKPDDSWTKN